jgi:hypothetical protein
MRQIRFAIFSLFGLIAILVVTLLCLPLVRG